MRPARALVVLVCLVAVSAAACATAAPGSRCVVGGAITECGEATGLVIAAEGPSAAQVTTFTLRTGNGQVIEFLVDRLDLARGGLPAPHLREHLVNGVPIVVEYKVESGRHFALHYIDAGP